MQLIRVGDYCRDQEILETLAKRKVAYQIFQVQKFSPCTPHISRQQIYTGEGPLIGIASMLCLSVAINNVN